jgi:two-component system cell cycle sensor histidine kinase/response regulator CckA
MDRRPKKQIAAGVSPHSSTELYQVLFEQAADSIFIADAQGHFIEVNRRGCEMLGYTHEEMLNLSWQDLVPAEDVTRAPLDELRTGKALLEEGWLRSKDGRFLPVEISVRMFSGGNLLGVARDISERKQVEQALRESELRYREVFENSSECIFLLDVTADGRFKFAGFNPAEEKAVGYPSREASGKFVEEAIPAELARQVRANYCRCVEGGTIINYDEELDLPVGRRYFHTVLIPVCNAASDIYRIVGIAHDITELKRVQGIMQARLRLLEFANSHSMDELLTAALDEIEALTGSTIGFYHFLGADQRTLSLQNWSTNTLKNMCAAEGKGSHYDIAQAGVWVDCVHERRPVIHNDYASLPHRKGMPEGHAPVVREVVVPIFRGDLIKAIIGVGNKSTNYDESDIEIVSQLGDLSWDIAERKRAESQREAALAALEEQYSTLKGIIDSTNALIFSVDRQYRYTSFNQGHAAVMKALYGAGIEIGHSLLDYMTVVEDRAIAKGNLDRALAGEHMVEEAYSGEELRSRRYFQVSHSPIKTDAGEVIGAAMLAQDMTERKRAEEGLRRANRALRVISDSNKVLARATTEPALLSDICRVIIETGGYRWAWIGFAEHNGLRTVRPVASAGVEEGYLEKAHVSWADNERGHGPGGTAIRTGRPVVCRDTATDPTFAPWRVEAAKRGFASLVALPLLMDGQVYGQMGIYAAEIDAFDAEEVELLEKLANDLTLGLKTLRARNEQQRAEEEIRKLSHAVEQSANIVIITDAQGYIEYANPRFTETTGYTLEEAIGQHTRILKSGHMPPEEYKRLWETITAGKEWRGEFHNKRKTGELYWESASISPIKNADGVITHFLAVKEDITESKRAEAAQARLEEQLRQAQRMECIGRLASGVAHDFNNLLTVIRGDCDLVRPSRPIGDPRTGDLEQIRLAGERAAGLTRQLLAFSRQQVMAPTVLDLNDLVTNLHKMLGRLIGEDITLSTILQPGLWSITADPGQIEQVIMNLAVNARDAMPTGGRLTIETDNVRLDESYAQTHLEAPIGPCVMLAVTDTGHGMDKPTQARIFEPFFTTKEPDKGTGLGLATVYGIVKQSGGDIMVYSEPGQGTIFKIYLPASETALKSPVIAQPHPSVSRGGHETILLVEDEKTVRELVRLTLQAEGYTVLEADSGSEALSLAKHYQGQIDLLMTDVVMPHMNGRELAEQLKALYPQLRILFMSGYTNETIVRHGVLATEIKFLPKPFSPVTLTSKVREVLDESA